MYAFRVCLAVQLQDQAFTLPRVLGLRSELLLFADDAQIFCPTLKRKVMASLLCLREDVLKDPQFLSSVAAKRPELLAALLSPLVREGFGSLPVSGILFGWIRICVHGDVIAPSLFAKDTSNGVAQTCRLSKYSMQKNDRDSPTKTPQFHKQEG